MKFPVVLFSPGDGARPASYQSIFQELVSNGYIVAGIHHPGVSGTVVFEDGVKIPTIESDELSEEEVLEIIKTKKPLCMDDMLFVWLVLRDSNSPLRAIMDFDKVGVLGSSLGAVPSMRMLRTNPNIRAGAQLDFGGLRDDANLLGEEYSKDKAFSQPFIHIFSSTCYEDIKVDGEEEGIRVLSKEEIEELFKKFHVQKGHYKSIIYNTKHMSFSDQLLLNGKLPILRTFGDKDFGEEDAAYETKFYAFTTLLRSFFDRFLKGQTEIDLMELNDEIVRIETLEE